MKSKIIVFITCLLGFIACQDDESESDQPIVVSPPVYKCFDKDNCVNLSTSTLTNADWELCARSLRDVSSGEETADLILDCEADDYWDFTSSTAYTFVRETEKCISTDANESGTWSYNTTQQTMTIGGTVYYILCATSDGFQITDSVQTLGEIEVSQYTVK